MNADDNENTVPAADFVRNFGSWRMEALQRPVFITSHKKVTHVLLNAAEFEDFKVNLDGNHASAPGRDEMLRQLFEWFDEAVIVCDEGYDIIFANRVAGAVCRIGGDDLRGKNLFAVLSSIGGTMMDIQIRRTAMSSEPSASDIPSPFAEGKWLHLQTFAFHERTVIKFRDITDDVLNHRLAETKATILRAMATNGAIGYARLSLRATIDRVNEPFCRMIGLSEARLTGANILELVSSDEKVAFRAAVERAIRLNEDTALTVSMISNHGPNVAARFSVVGLHGAYGAEGAVCICTTQI